MESVGEVITDLGILHLTNERIFLIIKVPLEQEAYITVQTDSKRRYI